MEVDAGQDPTEPVWRDAMAAFTLDKETASHVAEFGPVKTTKVMVNLTGTHALEPGGESEGTTAGGGEQGIRVASIRFHGRSFRFPLGWISVSDPERP